MKNTEPLFDYVLRQLDANKGRFKEISNSTGFPYSTLVKIAQRKIPNPGVNSVQTLADYFRRAA